MFDVESIHQIPPVTAALATDSVDIKDALNSEKAVATQLATEDTIPGQGCEPIAQSRQAKRQENRKGGALWT